MTTKTRILTNPNDITCPDGVIDEWLKEWNKHNVSPITLADLDDITYDFIYRAVDYGANQELHKVIRTMIEIHPEGDIISGRLLDKRRPNESSPRKQIMEEIEIFEQFVVTEMRRLKDKLESIESVSP